MPPRSVRTAADFDWSGAQKHNGLVRLLAKRLAKHPHMRYLDFDDLVQVGTFAVALALPRFNPEKGAVSTYVGSCARGAMLSLLRTTSPLRVPVNALDSRKPAVREFVDRALLSPVPLDSEFEEQVPDSSPRDPAELCVDHEDAETVRDAILDLPARHRFVIVRRVYQERTLDEVGTELGLSRERVRQLQCEAMQHLTKCLARRRTAVCA